MALNLASRAAIVRCSSVAVHQQAPSMAVVGRNSFQNGNVLVPRVCFSTTEKSPGVFERLRGGFEDRQKKQNQEKYREQIQSMANSEKWTLKNFSDQLDAATPSGWRSKIPGMSNTQEAQAAKQTQTVISGIIDEIGEDASMQEIDTLGRKGKLRVSLKSGLEVQDINIMIQQFKSMEIMHKVLRQRKSEGKPLPDTEDGMMALVQGYSAKVMTKAQRKDLQERRMKKMKGVGRR